MVLAPTILDVDEMEHDMMALVILIDSWLDRSEILVFVEVL
jgi:hypothetical protein